MAITIKYIDKLSVKEYEFLNAQIGYRLEAIANEIKQEKATQKDYVELRFLQHKIKNIIKFYKKSIDK